MDNNKFMSFAIRNIHLLILGGAFVVSSFGLIFVEKFDLSRLKDFGPVAHIYFDGIKNGLVVATLILFIAFLSFIILEKHIGKVKTIVESLWLSQSNARKNLLILLVCLIFVFASHAGNILNGYFNMDDFEVVGINHSVPFSQAILMPHGNDHTIPLFRAEMKALDSAFGQNKTPYNIFVFIVLALIPFFTYLTLKRLGFSILSFVIFLILFSGTTSWADMLTGFYIVSVYLQIIFFFTIAFWSYTAWSQSKKNRYMVFFTVAILLALMSDTSGLWVIPAIFFCIVCIYWANLLDERTKKLT